MDAFFQGHGELTLRCETGTDLYRRPGKSFNNATVRTVPTSSGGFAASVYVTVAQLSGEYQQAGLVFAVDSSALTDGSSENAAWIKAGVERWHGSLRASVVVTRAGVSDWSVADFALFNSDTSRLDSSASVGFTVRIVRAADASIVVEMKDAASDSDSDGWVLLRKTYAWSSAPALVGVMCAAPEQGPAFDAHFSAFKLLQS
ncbi:hypothetical protein HK100_003424 [Physocladia obscura]|uniref:Uncharacterized protein n=1 Tax=Physocladia obscura TaxID=109957 RepID=A0AAD5SW65_9FUNG|nr:hypothetical protein HK100_003424 [Physocladia obscura]